MKYTVEYCKNNKVAIFVDNEKDLISLHSTFNIKSPLFTMGVNYFFNFNSKYGYGNGGHYLKDNYELITFQEFMQNQTKKLTEFTDKDVIHCPTEEIANKICKLLHDKGFTWCSGSSYIGHNNWRPYQEETCYLVLKGRYDSKNFYENEGTIHKAEDILALYETDNLEERIMKETKIIGYKCPISLFNGEVEKGTLFVKLSDTMYEAQSPIKEVRTMKFLPKEIVETWVAVLEDEFKVGDWIIWDSCEKPYKIWKINNNTIWIIYEGRKENHQQYEIPSLKKTNLKKLTQTEIDSLFNKTLTLSNGKEVIVNKGVITAQNETIKLEDLKALTQWSPQLMLNSWGISLNVESVNIGCWKKVKISDLELIIKTCQEQIELMKD